MYEVDDADGYLLAWLGSEASSDRRQAVLDWVPSFAGNPARFTKFRKYPVGGTPIYTAIVPDADVSVQFEVIPPVEFDSPEVLVGLRVIKILDVRSLRDPLP